jgi:predicted  nucleic acid-binding Zn-ribbon protein
MERGKLKRAIARALAESEHAEDPRKSGLMDYGDLQRTVRRLRDTLQLAERAYDDLMTEYEELSERLTRSIPHDLLSPDGASEPRTYHT